MLIILGVAYKHFVGLGRPAILVACLAGPLGNIQNRYRLLPFSGPNSLAMTLTKARMAGLVLYLDRIL